MSEFDDEFLLRPGRVGHDRKVGTSFLGAVRKATLRAADAGIGRRGSGARQGRGAARGRCTGPGARRVIVKARIVRHAGARYRAAPLSRHIAYLEREGVTRDGAPAKMFDARGEQAQVAAFADRCEDDRHHFRFIVSPEDAGELTDLRAYARDLMGQMESDLGTRLDWVGIDHWNTDNPHVHVLVRGKADNGRDLVIAGDYVASGLRSRAEHLATLELGPRTQRQIEAALDAEVGAERWTGLDRTLSRAAAGRELSLPDLPGQDAQRLRLVGRLQHLEKLGLAQTTGAARWRLSDDLEPRLRDLSTRGDIIKTMHKAMARDGGRVDPARFTLDADRAGTPVVGRLVERGLHDELAGTAYVVIDGMDGRQHHVVVSDLAASSDASPGAIVEIRAGEAGKARAGPSLVVRSDLTLEAQVGARGATWLDRQLVAGGAGAGVGGFGGQVAAAADQRAEVLVERGLAQRRAGRIVLAVRLLERLEAADLAAASETLARSTGLAPRAGQTGERLSGTFQRRLDLASGRFAMLDDGLGFQLVRWSPSLEGRLGQQVSGKLMPGRRVDWTFGRDRGLGL
ncbi:DUF3363 domain-containing protein [Caulobacter hibisci]|uniref:DUF3363 domain-containing protein n=1 Tax=Caulobacter hibisci TaxID=2035993 RepID=A0ABS0SZX2_9CAUL|nr:DUF3363 domain-containing protein [Caulobacter hibisci]